MSHTLHTHTWIWGIFHVSPCKPPIFSLKRFNSYLAKDTVSLDAGRNGVKSSNICEKKIFNLEFYTQTRYFKGVREKDISYVS